MADKTKSLLNAAVNLIQRALTPHVRVVPAPGSHGDPATLEVAWTDGTVPRMLQLVEATDALNIDDRPGIVWVIRARLSLGDRNRLRDRGISFVNPPTGSVHIIAPGIVFDRTLPPVRGADWRLSGEKTDPFGDSASRVLRLLMRDALGQSGRAWGVRELAEATRVDRTTTSEVLHRLADMNLVATERALGRRGRAKAVQVTDPVRVLERWSRSYEWSVNSRIAVHAPIGSPQLFTNRLSRHLSGERWALTLQGAASAIAPHAAWERLHVYVDVPDDATLRAIATRENWPVADDGKLVLMRPYYRKSVWDNVQVHRNGPMVDIVQLLLDLWDYPVRGREQANHLLDVRRDLPQELFTVVS